MSEIIINRRNGEKYTFWVSNKDYENIKQYTYHYHHNNNGRIYAARWVCQDQKHKQIFYLHNDIFKLNFGNIPMGYEIDHWDNNSFNNLPENLRAVNRQQNMFNRKSPIGSTSPYKGVWIDRRDKIHIQITDSISNKKIHCGPFPNEEIAAKCYDVFAQFYHGEYARLNFPNETITDLKKVN